jgi:hypothetical protein
MSSLSDQIGVNKLTTETIQTPAKHPWLIICSVLFVVWVFGWVIGPLLNENIPIYRQIMQAADERDIDTSAYMYEESAGSYDAEYYLSDSFKHSGRDDYGPTLFFFSGIALCFIILGLGWRYIL